MSELLLTIANWIVVGIAVGVVGIIAVDWVLNKPDWK